MLDNKHLMNSCLLSATFLSHCNYLGILLMSMYFNFKGVDFMSGEELGTITREF